MSSASASSSKSTFIKSHHFTQSRSLRRWFCNICTPPNNPQVEYMNTRAAQHHELHSVEHARNAAELEMWWNPPAQDAAAWNAPIVEDPPLTIEEMKMRESRMHVDHVQDMVPFWIRGVEAAEKGEVLRLENFLETLQEASDAWLRSTSNTPWMHVNSEQGWEQWGEGWGGRVDGWDGARIDAVDTWGVRSTSSANGSGVGSNSQVRRRRQIPAKGRQQRRQDESRDRNITRERATFTNTFDFVEHVARQQSADEEQKRRMHTFFDMPTHEKIKKIDEIIRHLHTVHA